MNSFELYMYVHTYMIHKDIYIVCFNIKKSKPWYVFNKFLVQYADEIIKNLWDALKSL